MGQCIVRESYSLFGGTRYRKEHCVLESFQASSVFPSGKSNIWIKVSIVHWWRLREERKLTVFENMVLRRIFGPRREEVTEE